MRILSYILAAIVSVFTVSLTAVSAFAQENGRYAGMDKDEAGIWYLMDRIEEDIKTSGARIADPELNTYIQDLTCKIVGPDCDKLRIYIVNSPSFNASMAPNGMMLVNSGLMLRAANEAQLGCVIGHEYGHFAEGHTLKMWRGIKDANLAALFIPIAGGLVGLAAVSDFGRDQERDADKIGFEKIAAHGYDATQCATVWTDLIKESQTSVVKKVRKRANENNADIFASHPVPKERATTLKTLATQTSGGTKTGVQVYFEKTQPHLAGWLENELIAKDLDRHIFLFKELKARGRHAPTIDYYLGEAHRQRRGEGDKETALSYWLSAAVYEDAPPKTWRALAEHYRRKKNTAAALENYRTYLTKSPEAADRLLIEKYIKRLEGEIEK